MVPTDTPRKRKIYYSRFLVIAIIILSLSVGSAEAATKTKKIAVAKKTTTKTQVKGEKITANSISVVGNDSITTYTVKNGDTLSGIAEKFDISVNTIRWSNDITSKDAIKPGEKLIILPISGIIYTVKNGDTLSGIAAKYHSDETDILNANDFADADSIKAGMTLVIPDAEPSQGDGVQNVVGSAEPVAPITIPTTPTTAPVATPTVTTQTPATISSPITVPSAIQTPGTTMVVTNPVTTSTYTITVTQPTSTNPYPIPANDIRGYYAQPISGRLSQGIHPVNAVDIAAPIGTTVHAAADGTVIVAMGNGKYNGGYGNYIVISHPNGTQTLYAHLSQVNVTLGEMVLQGEPIALSGNTGDTTGPHLHFEIRGAVNPWGSDPLGTTYSI